MMIDGKKIADKILDKIKKKILPYKRKPAIAFILVGENPASMTYVRMKKKACSKVGMLSNVVELPENISEIKLLEQIAFLNKQADVDGILVQMPLPSHIDPKAVTMAIDPNKDVDGFHPLNMGKLLLGEQDGFIPCTPNGIKYLLQEENIEVAGKHVVIVGRSNIVGKPLAALLMQKAAGANATVTVVHSRSENLKDITKTADILVAAIGSAGFIKEDMIKKGVIIIDVGINRTIDSSGNKALVGDVDINCLDIADKYTPVPGGVGPMTIAFLLKNTLQSFLQKEDL